MTIRLLLLVLPGVSPASADSVVERDLVEVLGACSTCHPPEGMAGDFRIEEEFGAARPAVSSPVRRGGKAA